VSKGTRAPDGRVKYGTTAEGLWDSPRPVEAHDSLVLCAISCLACHCPFLTGQEVRYWYGPRGGEPYHVGCTAVPTERTSQGLRSMSDPDTGRLRVSVPTERVCEDCIGTGGIGIDHEACRREGGYMDDEDNDQRCDCHLTGHRLDNRRTA
jgi:hypothetical protein